MQIIETKACKCENIQIWFTAWEKYMCLPVLETCYWGPVWKGSFWKEEAEKIILWITFPHWEHYVSIGHLQSMFSFYGGLCFTQWCNIRCVWTSVTNEAKPRYSWTHSHQNMWTHTHYCSMMYFFQIHSSCQIQSLTWSSEASAERFTRVIIRKLQRMSESERILRSQ